MSAGVEMRGRWESMLLGSTGDSQGTSTCSSWEGEGSEYWQGGRVSGGTCQASWKEVGLERDGDGWRWAVKL